MNLNSVIIIFLCTFYLNVNNAQSLQATMKYVFIDGEEAGEYTGGIHIDDGIIKVGEVLKPKDENGVEYSFKVKKITDYDTDEDVQTLAKGKDGFIILETPDKKKLAKNPTGSLTFGSNTSSSIALSKADIGTVCNMDGQEWKGSNYYNSSSYFPNGNSLLKTKQPYLIISFRAAQSPDDRQLTLIHKEAKVGVGVLDKKNYELVLSGSNEGVPEKSCLVSNWKNGKANTQKTDFNFAITQFDDKGDHIIISAKYSGTIYGLNLFEELIGSNCKDVIIRKGEIKKLKVNKY